jgi:hypothetical protein
MDSGAQHRKLGFKFCDKFPRSFDDEEKALEQFGLAIKSESLHGTELADCYSKSGEIYRGRFPKTKDNYLKALHLFTKASEVPGLPSWYTPQTLTERLAMCPDIYGFRADWADWELATNMHKENLLIQNGGDLTITGADWFFHLLETTEEISNPKYTEVGIDYLRQALKKGWDDMWTSIMYTMCGRAFKFHMQKTQENFDKALE